MLPGSPSFPTTAMATPNARAETMRPSMFDPEDQVSSYFQVSLSSSLMGESGLVFPG